MDSPYAVIESGGKQHRVKVGQRLKLEKLPVEEGQTVELDKVMLVANGDNVQLGAPYLDKSKVSAKVLSHGRGDKITIIKMRRRKTYRRKQGHRQAFTEIEVTSIQ
ncbi:MAG: 50S ribosomal protein L21 [Gammaproteobacteria bacterium]